MPDEPENTTTATDDTTPPEGQDGTEEGQLGGQKAMPRDQRMRLQRNQARAERDALAARLEAMQTRELHRLVADSLANPEDIALSGLELSDFIGENGEMDAEAVSEAVTSILNTRPGLAKDYRPVRSATDPSQGIAGPRKPPPVQPTFADLLRG